MTEITIEKIKISLDDHSVTFLDQDKPEAPIVLPADAIDNLITFLRGPKPKTDERRIAFRVAISRLTDLAVRVNFKGKTWEVAPVDLSLTGILVQFLKTEIADIPIDAEVGIELRFDDKTAVLRGIVRRRQGNRYGILLANSLRNGELKPPETLIVIYKALERQWLRRRLK
ncbi:MAG: PilZ domain-containing protein [Deltaproteobacteria bacterium]|nr:PilZ domain-containing protein [Deltaproteobacteria bacterium]